MGCCYSACVAPIHTPTTTTTSTSTPDKVTDKVTVKFALKFPHGIRGIHFDGKSFVACENINQWISDLYSQTDKWKWWIIYNDETGHLGNKHHSKGHCKGILTWSADHIGWLCHSIPNFPRVFTGDSISNIEHSEHMYGQSLQYIEFPFTVNKLDDIIYQLQLMEPHIFNNKTPMDISIRFNKKKHERVTEISTCVLQDIPHIVHLAKSPYCSIDIYSEYIAKHFDNGVWKVESWVRGHHIENELKTVKDIDLLQFENTEWSESQDHSKWAVSPNSMYAIGDLNRMTSQFHRGGGMFVCENGELAATLRSLILFCKN